MGARAQLAGALEAGMSTPVPIVDNPRRVELEAQLVLQLVRTKLAPLPEAPTQWVSTFDLWVVAPGVDSSAVEDELDDAVDEVLQVLDRYPWVTWDTAERTTYTDGRAAYRVALTLILDSMAGAAPAEPEPPAEEPIPTEEG